MKVVFIAGPYRGANSWEVEQNIRRAEEAGFAIALVGAVPMIVHPMYRYWDGTLTDDFWLKATQTLMKRCDAVFFLKGWRDSDGSVAEHQAAEDLGLPIFYQASPGDIVEWIRGTP